MYPPCRFLLVPLWICFLPVAANARQSDGQTGAVSTSPPVQQSSNLGGELSSEVQNQFDTASALISQSRFREATELLRKAEAQAPGSPTVHHYLGYALWKQDQWSAAEKEFEKAHELDPRNAYTLYFLARIAQSTGRATDAVRHYEGVLRLGAPIYDTSQRLGQLYFDRGELEKAREQIESALKQSPWESSLYYQLGKIDQRAGQAATAQEEFASAARLKDVSQDVVQRLLALDQALQDHETGKIDALRSDIAAQASRDPEILQSMGVLLGRAGLYDQAREALERCVSLDARSFEAQYNLGLTLLRLNREQEAEARLLAALKLQPNSVEANRALGVLYVQQNRTQDAIGRLRLANSVSPGDARLLALLGQQYLLGHFAPDAIATLQQAVRLTPDNLDVRFLLVEAYDAARDYDAGLKAAQETLRTFPDSGRAAFEVSQEMAASGRYDDALPYAQQAVKKDVQLVEAWTLLGDLQSKGGHYDEALDAFQRARSLDASNVIADRGIADNLIRLKRYDEALKQVHQALDDHPQDAALYFSLMQAYVRTGQRDEASKAAAMYQQLHAAEAAQADAQKPRPYPGAQP
jgi:tetratricopeptide (TPR) repeat protein